MGRTFETLAVSEIVEINRRMIQSFGVFFEDDRRARQSPPKYRLISPISFTSSYGF
jgi:hypothetical protein